MFRERWGHRGADDAGTEADHKGHFLGGQIRGSNDEIAFIFARQVVKDDNKFTVL
jgi:hypothetical protein